MIENLPPSEIIALIKYYSEQKTLCHTNEQSERYAEMVKKLKIILDKNMEYLGF